MFVCRKCLKQICNVQLCSESKTRKHTFQELTEISQQRSPEKNRKINSTFVDKDSFPAPHQGHNKGYESLDSMFIGFRSTFAAKKE